MTYRILSFDGGGIRGRLSIELVKRLEVETPGVVAKADMLAGTSTGGIIALALAFGMTPTEVGALYGDNGASIFDAEWVRAIEGFDGLREAKYDNAKLKQILQKKFGNARLSDLKQAVVVPTLALRDGNPAGKAVHFLTNLNPTTATTFLWQAGLMTSAAPTYFPSFGVYVDGGVVANDPSMCAVIRALKHEGVKLEDIQLLSIGTGWSLKPIDGEDHDAGLLWWAPKMIDMLLDGNVQLAEEQCVELLGDTYYRINPILQGTPVGLDEWKRQDELVKIAQQTAIEGAVSWLKSVYFA